MWSVSRSGDAIVAHFSGRLVVSEGQQSVSAFCRELDKGPATAVFDIREMEGYDGGAREAWQKGLSGQRDKINEIIVVGGSPLIRLGASMIGVFVRIPVRNVDKYP